MKTRMQLVIVSFAFALSVMVVQAEAALVSVSNPSFETNGGGGNGSPVTDWEGTGGYIQEGVGGARPTPYGSYWGVMSGGGGGQTLSQSLGGKILNNVDITYTDLLLGEQGTGVGSVTLEIAIFAGNPLSGGVLIDSATHSVNNTTALFSGSLNTGTLYYGEQLYLRFRNATGATRNINIDNVVLSGVVLPEPSTGLLMGVGIFGLVVRCRRRRK